MAASSVNRTTPQLYRDCLRLVHHIASNSSKAHNIRNVLRQEFRKNASVTDSAKIEELRANAIRGLANYLMMQSGSKDQKFVEKMNEFQEAEMKRTDND